MSLALKSLCVAAALIAAVSAHPADHCAKATNCATCVSLPLCGWCSVPIIYSDNSTGPQCAGFDTNHSTPGFICNAVYSTEVCQRGWKCDESTDTCVRALPGHGQRHGQCERDCHHAGPTTTPAPVYLCNHTSKQCNAVPAGTANSSSLVVCEAECQHKVTPAPGPAAKVYACNISAWQCHEVPPGTAGSSSLQVCEESCNKTAALYLCNEETGNCDYAPPGTKGAIPLAQCQKICANVTPAPTPPTPGPPPEYIGVWRGIEIQANYTIHEWDMMFNMSTAIIVSIKNSGTTTIIGVPYHVPNSPTLEMWIEVTSGPGAGQTIRTIGDTSGAAGPQNAFATLAMGVPGGATPKSISSAMTDGTSKVFALATCIVDNEFCVFSLPDQTITSHRDVTIIRPQLDIVTHGEDERRMTVGGKFDDRCSQWGEACSVCLTHSFCGWCSVPVHYADGKMGTQCAGFQGSTPFTCPGRYSTTGCEVGYQCQSGSWDCIPTQPGNGMPKEVCEATCKQTPSPAPRVKQYVCNTVNKTCTPCTAEQCPGSMPLAQCEDLCPHPHPGPTPALMGVWRGIYVQNDYSIGEVDFVFSPAGVNVYKNGVLDYNATVITLGADVLLFNITFGPNTGSSLGFLYQMAIQDYGMYEQMTIAQGKLNGPFPVDFNTPMYTPGMREMVLAKCMQSPCNFPRP